MYLCVYWNVVRFTKQKLYFIFSRPYFIIYVIKNYAPKLNDVCTMLCFFPIFDKEELYLIFSRPYFALHMGWTRKTRLFIRFETHTFLHWSASFEGCSIIWQRSFCIENCLFTPDWRLCCGFQWWKSGLSIFINCQLRSKCKNISNYCNSLAFYK